MIRAIAGVKHLQILVMSSFIQIENMTFLMDLLFVEINVRIPDQIKSKQLKVNITSSTILVAAQIDREWKTILDGTLSGKCKATDAMWTITGQNKLNINIGLSIVIIHD